MKTWRCAAWWAAATCAGWASPASAAEAHRVTVFECAPGQFGDKPCPQSRTLLLSSGPDRSPDAQARVQSQTRALLLELERLQLARTRAATEESGWPPPRGGRPPSGLPNCPEALAKRAPATAEIQPMRRLHRSGLPHRRGQTPACFGLPLHHPACQASALPASASTSGAPR